MEIDSRRLTKRLFMGLPPRVFVVSHLLNAEGMPTFHQWTSAPGAAREMQWEAVKNMKVDQRSCIVFPSEDDFWAWYNEASQPIIEKAVNGVLPDTPD